MRNFFEYLWFGLEMFFSLVILIISIMFTVASIHNINMTEDIKQFIESATFEFETNGTYYYKVTDTSLDEDTLMYDEVSITIHRQPHSLSSYYQCMKKSSGGAGYS